MIFDHNIGYWLSGFLLVIIFSMLTYVLAEGLARRKWKVIYVAPCVALLLTLLTLFFLQGHSILFKEEASVMAGVYCTKKKLGIGRETENFVDSNFVLVNTRLNPELIPYKEASFEDSARQVITNRRMLTSLLQFLNEANNLIDLVVCDVLFTDSTRQDRNLITALEQLQKKNKLVLAYNKDFAAEHPFLYKNMDVASFGDVTKVKNEVFYFSHELLSDENIPSLPYAMYLKLYRVHPPATGKRWLCEDDFIVQKNFIPEFNYVNEKALYQRPVAGAEPQEVKLYADTQLYSSLPKTIYTLGYVAGKDGQQEILDLLNLKSRRHHTIVFISNFGDAYIDRHPTAYGKLYGTTLLLNEFYYINAGHHRMSVFTFVLYIITLLVLYSLLMGWVLYNKAIVPLRATAKAITFTKWKFVWNWLIVIAIAIEVSHYFFLFGIALIIDILFHKIINVMGLLYFFLLFSALLKFFVNHFASQLTLFTTKTK